HPGKDPDAPPRHLPLRPDRPRRPGARTRGRDRGPRLRGALERRARVPPPVGENDGVNAFAVELRLARFDLRAEARLEGGVTAIMGPSGSGKTSLLEVLAGLRRGARGRVATGGASGGAKQRVALARALASDARLLLLDEPLAALDVALRERILPYLLRIRDEWRVPALYVTHNVGEAVALADRVLLLRDGAVEALGAPLDLLAMPVLAEAAAAGIENLLQGRVSSHDEAGGVTRVVLDGGAEVAIPLARERLVGTPVVLAVRAEDVLVTTGAIAG